MFKLQSIVVFALLLAVAQACPYLAREEEKGGNLRDQSRLQDSARRTQAMTKPKSTASAVAIASNQIEKIITDIKGMEAKFVRLAFHDCVGGCDGCVDMSNPSNFGLDLPIDALEPVVQHNTPFLTTGDVWALAGLVAARLSQKVKLGPREPMAQFRLQYAGRRKCAGGATKGGPQRQMPSAHFTTKQVVDFFKTTFGFSHAEAAIIMGAHSL
jgi:Peroxidase